MALSSRPSWNVPFCINDMQKRLSCLFFMWSSFSLAEHAVYVTFKASSHEILIGGKIQKFCFSFQKGNVLVLVSVIDHSDCEKMCSQPPTYMYRCIIFMLLQMGPEHAKNSKTLLPCPRFLMSYLIGMCSVLMFGAIRGIAESFWAAGKFASVGFFSGVRSQMSLEVLQPRICFGARLELKQEMIFNQCIEAYMLK